MNTMKTTLAALGLALAVTPAYAQVNANNLVSVNISQIDLSDLVDVEITDNVVQVPIGVAATVCDVNANILAQQARDGGATCDATTTSTALARAVEQANR